MNSSEPARAAAPHAGAPLATGHLLRQLVAWGVRHVFTLPGLQIDPLNQALAASEAFQTVVANHELAAGYMADGYARAAGGPAAVFAIGGPGCANLMGAMVAARADRSPVLFVTGNIPTAAQGRGEFQDGGAQGANDLGMAAAALGESLHCAEAGQLPGLLARAAQRLARGEPAHLTIAHDVQLQPAPPARLAPPAMLAADAGAPPVLPREWLAQGRVALFVDAQALAAGEALVSAVRGAARRFGLPVITAPDARGVIDEGAPQAAGHLGFMPHPRAEALLAAGSALRAQQVLQIGGDARWHARLQQRHGEVRLVTPAAFGAWWRGAAPAPDAAMLALRRQWCDELAALQRPAPAGDTRSGPVGPVALDPAGLTYAGVVEALAAARPADTAWVVDAGQVRRVAAARLRCRQPRTLFMAEGMAPMGWSLGAAIGVALAQPRRPVVALLGDGAMRMHGIEIASAARYRLPILYVLFDNQSYGSVLQRMASTAERAQAQLPAVDWPAFARAFGVACHEARDNAGLQQALVQVQVQMAALGAPCLLVVRVPAVDPDAFSEPTGIDWCLPGRAPLEA